MPQPAELGGNPQEDRLFGYLVFSTEMKTDQFSSPDLWGDQRIQRSYEPGICKVCLILSDYFFSNRTNMLKWGKRLKYSSSHITGNAISRFRTLWKTTASNNKPCFSEGSKSFSFYSVHGATPSVISPSPVTCVFSAHTWPQRASLRKVLEICQSFPD